MSSCSSIYIEFKKRGDQQWHLLEGIVPLDYRDRSYCGEDDSHDSNHAVEIGGERMFRMFGGSVGWAWVYTVDKAGNESGKAV